jgi:flavin reductase (DIM6/NTAB) family NADH-FMN oxidoreductase RutF
MLFDLETLDPRLGYKILVSTIVPRPIAWVVSSDTAGTLNAAPFSFFNAFSSDPPVIGIGISRRSSGDAKDTRANIAATGEFVVNLVSEDTAAAMNITAVEFEPRVNELAEAGVTTIPSTHVTPPRIAESPVAFECRLLQIVEPGPKSSIVLGRVVAVHVRDEAVVDAGRCDIDTRALRLIGRMHGSGWYARTSDLFEMPRLPLKEWIRTREGAE